MQVGLQSVGQPAYIRLEDRGDIRVSCKGRARGIGVGSAEHEVELLDRLPCSAQFSGDSEALRVRSACRAASSALSALVRGIGAAVARMGADVLDALEDGCLGLGAKPLEGGELAGAAGLLQGVEGLNAECLADGVDLARPQPGDPQHVEQALGRCGPQLFIGLGRAGVGELGDQLGHAVADAFDLG